MNPQSQGSSAASLLASAGASKAEIAELIAYNESPFDPSTLAPGARLPMADEAFVDCWRDWAEEAREHGAVEVLRRYLPQLSFPVEEGISRTAAYRDATLRGQPPPAPNAASDVPGAEHVELHLHSSLAGHVPVLIARRRDAFVALVRILSKRNEPAAVPDAKGASMVAGFNNWHRIHLLRRRWEDTAPKERQCATWGEEFARIRQSPELFRDRFILLSDGPYSAVPASDLGLEEDLWRSYSLSIRLEHECTHYLTRRLFGAMRNNVLDELLADYAGLVAATGHYRADWFLRFLGLEDFPDFRPGGRLEIYRGKPPLSDGAFRVLQGLVHRAAHQLEAFDARFRSDTGDRLPPRHRSAIALLAIAAHRLEDLASESATESLLRAAYEAEEVIVWQSGDS